MKNIVIIGGSDGIGLALVQNLNGENIVNISTTPCAVAGVKNIVCDVTNTQKLKAAFDEVEQIDALIYCAGTSLAAPVECIKPADYKRLFEVNLFGVIECVKYAAEKLKASSDGRIIALSSSGAITPIAYDSYYSASKAGLNALCAALRLELPEIKSTAVVIGGTQTQFSFKRKIYNDCAAHDKQLKTASDALIKIEQTGCPAEKQAREIKKLLYKKSPPPIVTIGAKNKLAMFVYKMLPWRIKLYAMRKTYGLTSFKRSKQETFTF